MTVSHAPRSTASRPTPPADPHAVLSFLAAGHTTLETATRFGIAERSVRRIRQRQDERDEQARRMQRMTASSPAERQPARSADTVPLTPLAPAVPTFGPVNPTDIAGPHTLWRCPVSGELTPVPPGAKRGEWEAERRSPPVQRTPDIAPTADIPDRPDTWTGHAFTASASAMDTGPEAVQSPPLPAQSKHNTAPVISITDDYVRRRVPLRPTPRRWEMAQLVEVCMYMVGPVPLVAWVIVVLGVVLLMGR